ncbi:MAG: O-antigen ligase family protein [Clostridia bacterium]|nr:O-antigen ligase family protein [Clostridia bacterium]
MSKNKIFDGILTLGFFVFFFMPRAFEFVPVASAIYARVFWAQFAYLLLGIALTALCGFRNVMNQVTVGIGALLATECVVCLAHSGDYNILFHHGVQLMAVYLFVSYEFQSNPKQFIRTAAWYFTLLIAINLALLILMPDGVATVETFSAGRQYKQLDRVNFLEVDNRLSLPIGLAILTAALAMDKGLWRKLLFAAAAGIGLMTNLITRSGTGLVGSFVLVGYILLFYVRRGDFKFINLFNLIVVYVIAMFLVVYASLIPVVQAVIRDWLNKDLTFSGRTEIWELCLKKVAQSPLLGQGNFESGWTILWRAIGRNAHNIFLDVLYQGGAVMLLGYGFMLGMVLTRAASVQTKKSQLVLVFLFSMYLVMLCESFFYNSYLYLFYALALCPEALEAGERRLWRLKGVKVCLRNA